MEEKKIHQQIMSYAEVVSFIVCPLMKFFENLYTPVDEAGLKLTEVPVSASQPPGGTTNLGGKHQASDMQRQSHEDRGTTQGDERSSILRRFW